MRKMMRGWAFVVGALWVAGSAVAAAPQVTVNVDIGWGGVFSLRGNWTPIFVTCSCTDTRNALLAYNGPHDAAANIKLEQDLGAIGPKPKTFVFYVPFQNPQGSTLSVIDADTRRSLPLIDATTHKLSDLTDSIDMGQIVSSGQANYPLNDNELLIGTSGRAMSLADLIEATRPKDGNYNEERLREGHLPELMLPPIARGYDSLSLLVLSEPNLSNLDNDQQQAIVDWVCGGGHLLIWLGTDAIPATSKLARLLPGTPGVPTSVEIPAATGTEAGLSKKSKAVTCRTIAPTDDAARIPILAIDALSGARARRGLGTVTLLPFDPTLLVFDEKTKEKQLPSFWGPLLAGSELLKKRAPTTNEVNGMVQTVNNRISELTQMKEAGITAGQELIGDVPGVGAFGFGYVFAVMLGMMVVVGPLDWFVLRRLGRQPWTWVTTSGWIGLVTFGALYAGHIIHSGDVEVRTLTVIDEADNRVVGATSMAGIYANRTRGYEPMEHSPIPAATTAPAQPGQGSQAAPDMWWEPLGVTYNGYSGRALTTLDFSQDYRGNHPQPMWINIWTMQFLEMETPGGGQAALSADLRMGSSIEGTIFNHSSVALKVIAIAGSETPGTVDLKTAIVVPANGSAQFKGSPFNATPPEMQNLYNAASVAASRTLRLKETLAADHSLVCLYAISDQATPSLQLPEQGVTEHHWMLIRSLQRLQGVKP